MITLVTSLYDINRENFDGRGLDQYIEWTQKTLQLKHNFVIYTSKEISPLLPKQDNVKIIIQDIPLIHLIDPIQSILSNKSYRNKIEDPDRIECNVPLYTIIQYSKFKWLINTIENNPFDSKYFFWIDAGCSRFFNFDTTKQIQEKKIPKAKLFIQGNVNTNKIDIDDSYIYKSDCVLVGTFFGGDQDRVCLVSYLTLECFREMRQQNIINNEQIALALVKNKYPALFDTYLEDFSSHLTILKYLYE